MDGLRSVRVVAAVIDIEGEVMLVRQQGPADPAPMWALPGGRVEPGESLVQALGRELLEETGLTLDPVSPALLYVTEVFDPHDAMHSVAFVFRVRVLPDSAPISNPAGSVLEARFVPIAEAEKLVGSNPYLPMGEPPAAYLRGVTVAFWSYVVSPLGVIERVIPQT